MEKTFIFAGFGGQGMLLIGKFMAMACMLDGKHVSWLPSYGPEMRGGTANCSVIVSDEPVASPLVDKADVIVAMNRPSLDKFEDHVKPGGVLVINSSIIDRKAVRDDIQVVYCDANAIAESIGNPKGANVAILGAVLEKVPVTTVEQMTEAIRTVKKRIRFAGWNKDERPESKRYKPYKLGRNQYGCVICRWYHILELELDGETYGVYFPPYERPAFEAATGLKAE